MAPITKTPVFLERQSYRMRRMMDAVRLLPFLGVALWMVPLMWPLPDANGGQGTSMSVALRYIFGVWCLLPFCAWLLWRRTRNRIVPESGATPEPKKP
ncbi:hypothetical protein Z946_282 [Sulfitobacter noctilucicola]|uniref:hypothetical protein n=1 Tax=Sulfitobacter noctilucicola TaxID=1342301 RepID=UPI00055B164D|nr:hypothetical protein [Sulfitobacter noctilucicola]KIN66270.1 hypothetical protein Z946_282 [Sulfitobacter noctilucicola]